MHGKQNIKQHTEQHKHLRKSAGRAPSLRVIPWHLPFCKSRETLGYLIHKNIKLENPKNYFMYRQLLLVEPRFSAPVQTGPGAHLASCTMGTGSSTGVKCSRGVALTTNPRLARRLKKEYSYTSTPHLGLRGLF